MATITKLTNTTWKFNFSQVDFQHWVLKKFNIVFICNSTRYSAMSCTINKYESSVGKYCDSLYYETPNASSLAYRCEYADSHGEMVDRYNWYKKDDPIQIINGDVYNSSLINFLSDNATCQTPLVTVTFNMNGIGTSVSSQTFAKGSKADMPIPSDDGYIFAGWYTNSSLTTRFNFNMSIMSNSTLYAKWIPKAIKTKVGGAWNSGTPLVKVNNAWKDIDKMFVKVNGVWKQIE